MKYKKSLFTIVLATFTASCSHMPGIANEDVRQIRVTEKAVWDFKCEKNLIKVTKINDTTYGAEGCGQRVSYLMDKCGSGVMWGYDASTCTAVLNSIEKPIR